jgi:hypothetical protein
VTRAEAQRKAMELEAEGSQLLGDNAMKLRMWEFQVGVEGGRFYDYVHVGGVEESVWLGGWRVRLAFVQL